jgi:hypothetical protein
LQEARAVVEEARLAQEAVALRFEVAKLLRNHPYSGMDWAEVEREIIRMCGANGVRLIFA